MRNALRTSHRGQKSQTRSIPAPIGGWNARDPLATMPETDAVQLDNWFPTTGTVVNRLGSEDWATGLPAQVNSLMAYGGATQKLFAASGTEIYDVTSQGAVGAAVVTGLTSSKFKYTNISTAGGKYLYCVNGADSPRMYDGTNWTTITGASTPAITGVTTSTLCDVVVWKNRLFFTEVDSLSVWYLPVNSIGGAASEIDFGPLFKLGGEIVTVATWTIDGGYGMDDHLVIITDKGEVAVYRGTDPSSAADFALIGVYRIGAPIGTRPCVKMGGDLLIITLDGVFPLSKALQSDRVDSKAAITDKISGAMSDAASAYQFIYGWQATLFPKGDMLLINVPYSAGTRVYQYVMNTTTGAWCRFTGWNANAFELLSDDLYFATNTKVCKAWTGTDDSGSAITVTAKQAHSSFGNMAALKHWKGARPIFSANLKPTLSLGINVDFADSTPAVLQTISSLPAGIWDSAKWDRNAFDGSRVYKEWRTISGIGYYASFYMQITSDELDIAWQSTDFLFEVGGVL